MANPLMRFEIATFVRGGGVGTSALKVTDVRELQKRLKAIDPTLRTELVRNAKKEAEPTVDSAAVSLTY